jgi:5'-phosphate synthase pdxT subunit
VAGSAERDPRPVGVLALQGDFREHVAVLTHLGADVIAVRRPEEALAVSGLVIPGGESSVIDKLSRSFGVADAVKKRIAEGMPVYGTCAGLIMIADRLVDAIRGQQSFGGLDVAVRRNAFGGQTESFEADLEVPVLGDPPMHAVFIRAPVVAELGERARALARLEDGTVVAVEQGNLLGTSFHPEMTADYRFHQYFLDKVAARASGS